MRRTENLNMVAMVETYAQTKVIFTIRLTEPGTCILKLSSWGGYRYLGISYCWGIKQWLITRTAVEFHPHGDVIFPCCGYQSDVLRFDWRNQSMFYHGVWITVSIKHLVIINGSINTY